MPRERCRAFLLAALAALPSFCVQGRALAGEASPAAARKPNVVFPTILEMLGLDPAPGQTFDGISFVSALKGRPLERKELFCHFPHYVPASDNLPATWVRQGDLKLILFHADGPRGEDRFELYDLKSDIGESKDLSAARPEKVKELGALISRHLETIQALVPRPNPAYREGATRAALRGWTGSKDALLALGEGCLVVESSGKDPWFFTRDVPAGKGPFTVELRMRSTGAGMGQVFWATAGKRNFHRDRSVTFQVTHDGAWHDYAVKLPFEEAITAVRIDPGTAPGEMAIRDLRLKDAEGKTIKEWEFRGP